MVSRSLRLRDHFHRCWAGAGIRVAATTFTLLIAACSPEAPVPLLAADLWYTRASLDLLGVRPDPDTLLDVRARPESAEAAIDELFDDPRFEDRMRDLWAEALGTRWDGFALDGYAYGLDDTESFHASIGEEPTALVARVVAGDLPWTEVVTADWTMADAILARAWPLERSEGPGWTEARYTDGRPAAGVLSTQGFHSRYGSTESNANRGRANEIARFVLCDAFLDRQVSFDRTVDLLDEEGVRDAVRTHERCVGCHVALDPMAAYLHGFDWTEPGAPFEANRYHPQRERRWTETAGVGPAYYGQPGGDLATLGLHLAADPRLPTCAVDHAFTLLLRRAPAATDRAELRQHRERFLGADLRMKALLRSVIHGEAYRKPGTEKALTVDQIASSIEALTGFRWMEDGRPLLEVEEDGLRTLAGGFHGPSPEAVGPRPTAALVVDRLAWLAARHASEHRPELWGDLPVEGPSGTATDTLVAEAAQALHLAVFGTQIAADGVEAAALVDLWQSLEEAGVSWPDRRIAILAALLRDPRFHLI